MEFIRITLTILFGAVPATYLSFVPAIFVGLGAYELAVGTGYEEGFPYSLALIVVYCLMALYGTLSLWLVSFCGPRRFVVIGLIAGMIAISPFTYSAVFEQWLYDTDDWLYSISAVFPFLTALCWLVAFGIDKYNARALV